MEQLGGASQVADQRARSVARSVAADIGLSGFSPKLNPIYSPNSNPFGDRPLARTPQGVVVAGREGDAWLLSAGGSGSGDKTPRLTVSWNDLPASVAKLSAKQQPGSVAAKWLNAMSPASSKSAGAAAERNSTSPSQPAAAAAAVALSVVAALASPRGNRGAHHTPAVAPSPAATFPRSHPIKGQAKPAEAAASSPTGGLPKASLASWLRQSSHLSKPAVAAKEEEAVSSPGSVSTGNGGLRTSQSQAAGPAEAEAALSAKEVPAGATDEPVAEPVKSTAKAAQMAVPGAACAQPHWGSAPKRQAITKRGDSPVLRAMLVLCLLAGLLAVPAVLPFMAPGLAQRTGLVAANAHARQLTSDAAQQASWLASSAYLQARQLTVIAAGHANRCASTAMQQASRLTSTAKQQASRLTSGASGTAERVSRLTSRAAERTIQLTSTTVDQARQLTIAVVQQAGQLTSTAVGQANRLKAGVQRETSHVQAVTSQAFALFMGGRKAAAGTAAAAASATSPAVQTQQKSDTVAKSASVSSITAAPQPARQPPPRIDLTPKAAKRQAATREPLTATASSVLPPAARPQPASALRQTQSTAASVGGAAAKPQPLQAPVPAVPELLASTLRSPAAPAQPGQLTLATRLAFAAASAKAAVLSWCGVSLTSARADTRTTPAAHRTTRLVSTWQLLKARLPTQAAAVQAPAAPTPPAAGAIAHAADAVRAWKQHLWEASPAALMAVLAAALAGTLGILGALPSGGKALEAQHPFSAAADDAMEVVAEAAGHPSTTPAIGGRVRRREPSVSVPIEAQEQATPGPSTRRHHGNADTTGATPGATARSTRRAVTALAATPVGTARRRSTRLAASHE